MTTGPERTQRHRVRLATVAFLRHDGRVLLLQHPADSDRFAGRWNGVGGHVEAGEDIREAALRELSEEAGILPDTLELRGVIHETGLLGQAYVIFLFVGDVTEPTLRPAAKVRLEWHPVSNLGTLALVEDLQVLLPRVLAAREPVFVTERYDGGDASLALRIAEDER